MADSHTIVHVMWLRCHLCPCSVSANLVDRSCSRSCGFCYAKYSCSQEYFASKVNPQLSHSVIIIYCTVFTVHVSSSKAFDQYPRPLVVTGPWSIVYVYCIRCVCFFMYELQIIVLKIEGCFEYYRRKPAGSDITW